MQPVEKKHTEIFRQKAIAVFLYLHFSTPRSPYVLYHTISHPIPFCLAPWFFFSDNPGWIRIPGRFTVWPVLGVNVASRENP